MYKLRTPAVPHLSEARLLARRRHLVAEVTQRRRRRRRRRSLALGGIGVAAAGVSTSLVMLFGGAPSAFAAWSAAPTAPAPGQLASAEQTCSARPTNPPPGTPTLPTKVSIADTRGPFTLLLYGTNTSTEGALLCMSGPNGSQLSVEQGKMPALPGAGHLTLDRLQGQTTGSQAYTVAEGSVGAGVSRATLVLSDGTHVVATVGDGLFLAWWPGRATVTSASVTTATGTITQAISAPSIDTSGDDQQVNSGLRALAPPSA
jgi:hypothetical protein